MLARRENGALAIRYVMPIFLYMSTSSYSTAGLRSWLASRAATATAPSVEPQFCREVLHMATATRYSPIPWPCTTAPWHRGIVAVLCHKPQYLHGTVSPLPCRAMAPSRHYSATPWPHTTYASPPTASHGHEPMEEEGTFTNRASTFSLFLSTFF